MTVNPLNLTPVVRALKWCLHLLMAGLLSVAVGRAVVDGSPHPFAVVGAAACAAIAYAVGPLLPPVGRGRLPTRTWLACLAAIWLVLLALTPDGVWVAFPLYFLQLHLLPRRIGTSAVAVTALVAAAGYSWHHHEVAFAAFVGPVLGAAVAVATVLGYQTLYRESDQRRVLIDELTETRAELALAGQIAGTTAERERLAREIHDTLAQGLSSIQLLLRAAERALASEPATSATHRTAPEKRADGVALRYVEQARRAAQDNLDEARRFVHALVPPDLAGEGASAELHSAVDRLCHTTTVRHGLQVRFQLAGSPVQLSTSIEAAVLRIAQSALGNTVAHAQAKSAAVTLSYMDGQVALDVVDDGQGFAPEQLPPPEPGQGGFGFAAMRARARALGGTLTVESAPGKGTAVAVQLPSPAHLKRGEPAL